MREIKLIRLEIDNFKGTKHRVVEFGKRVFVKGRNGVGKSTLYDAVLWVLFDKNAQGNRATDIRPHDENGVDIDNIDISVAATFDVDGRKITLKKTQKQIFVKDRATREQKFKGNENTFEVNGIPKTERDYKAYIEENFCPEDVFLSCSNAMSFFRLDTKKRRAKLMQLAKEFTDADVYVSDKTFEPLKDMLMDGTVEELMTRSKSTINRLNELLKTIPARIDEQEKSKVDIDVAELELSKKDLQEKISEIEAKENDLSKQHEEYQKASDGILELQFQMNDLQMKANQGIAERRKEIQSQINEKVDFLLNIENGIQRNNREIAGYQKEIESGTRERNRLAEQWKSVNAEVFDESTTVCPTCHRTLPEAEITSLREAFEQSKAKRLEDIVRSGNGCKADIDNAQSMIPKLEQCQKDNFANKKKLEEEVTELEKQLSELPDSVDISTTEEYKALARQIAEKEEFLSKCSSAEAVRKQLSFDKSTFQTQLWGIEQDIAKLQRNVNIDQRIEELQAELRATSQKIADEERILDLLERFNRAKMNMLTEKVNQYFKVVKWRLFTENINGGYSDVCQAIVGGSDYERGLNDSDCLLANIDILETFQRMNDVSIPIFLDRAESINAERIPQTDGQLICLIVSDDREMVVE